MQKQEIEELIRLVEQSEIRELEVCEGRRKIRISKNGTAASAHAGVPVPVPVPAAPAVPPAESEESTGAPSPSSISDNRLQWVRRCVSSKR
jgi:biotin carboxyl carrier protein